MSESNFIDKAHDLIELHNKLTLDIEKFRVELGQLESLAKGGSMAPANQASQILSITHHFILNGTNNQVYALREGIRRAMQAYKQEQEKAQKK